MQPMSTAQTTAQAAAPPRMPSHSTSMPCRKEPPGSKRSIATAPEENYIQYSYDGRGNVTQTRFFPKPGSGAPTLTLTAGSATVFSPASLKMSSPTDSSPS